MDESTALPKNPKHKFGRLAAVNGRGNFGTNGLGCILEANRRHLQTYVGRRRNRDKKPACVRHRLDAEHLEKKSANTRETKRAFACDGDYSARLLDQPELCPKIALVALDFGPQESVNAVTTRPRVGRASGSDPTPGFAW